MSTSYSFSTEAVDFAWSRFWEGHGFGGTGIFDQGGWLGVRPREGKLISSKHSHRFGNPGFFGMHGLHDGVVICGPVY
jgi:hypothetical protein